MSAKLSKEKGFFFRSVSATSSDGQRTVIASESWVPFAGVFTVCSGRDNKNNQKDK